VIHTKTALPRQISPSHKTCYRRYRQWQLTGLMTQILRILNRDLRDRGGLDFVQAYMDGLLHIHRVGVHWFVINHPSLDGTWQLAVAKILLWRSVKLLRKPKPLFDVRWEDVQI
jgi:hypothetical protein